MTGRKGLKDKRLARASARRAPVDEVLEMTSLCKSRYRGWSVKHFHAHYRRSDGKRSFTRVKSNLQAARWTRAISRSSDKMER
ncbi:MAG: hypothetical protein HY266_01020 [Deltaproteobacteria bacterium]|nr:hypothetical protein [Deltaproteobacteria bacterium]